MKEFRLSCLMSDGLTGHGVGDGIYCYVFDNDVGDGHAIHGVVTIMLVSITFIVTNVTRRE